jgi:cobalt/nickel transport system ATP-binding protein
MARLATGVVLPDRGSGDCRVLLVDLMTAIELNDLCYRYPDQQVALDGVDLVIRPGERVALLGPNGAGKTTLMLHLNGVLTPTSGSVRICGLPATKKNMGEIRRRVGVVFQDPDDQLFMPRVREDIAFGPANLGLRDGQLDERIAEALTAVDMNHVADRPPHHLSGGQKRRVALATVLAMRPEILVLDEPSSNLDPYSRREFAHLLLRLEQTVVLATHDLPYAVELCPRSVIINNGRIVADGMTRDLLRDTTLLVANRLELPYGFSIPER